MKKIPNNYEELSEIDRKIVDEMRRFNSLSDFRKDSRSLAHVIETRLPYLKEIVFPRKRDVNINKMQIVLFCEANDGNRPSRVSKCREEVKLANIMGSYLSPGSRGLDSEFRDFMDSRFPSKIDLESVKNNKLAIVSFCETNNGNRPSKTSKDIKERKLAEQLSPYMKNDPEFRDLMNFRFPSKRREIEKMKLEIIAFCEVNGGSRPSYNSKNLKEKSLAMAMVRCMSVKINPCNSEFRDLMNSKFPSKKSPSDSAGNKQKIVNFCENNGGNRPSQYSKDYEESRLYRCMSSYISPANKCYDKIFAKMMTSKFPTKQAPMDSTGNKSKIVDFFEVYKKCPSRDSSNPEEARLGRALSNYMSSNGSSFDEKFALKIKKMRKDLKKKK